MHAAAQYPLQFGKYVLLRPLATGGMAEVFLAQMSGPAGFDKACVVKRVLRSHVANQQFMQMFLDEARVIARLSHPNVVQVFDMGQVDDDYFMAMEYVPGIDMQHLLDALPQGQRRLSVPVACRIVAQVAEGLDHAHRAVDGSGAPLGIVHRDVSPSNIIVSVDGVSKICDFGIAKFGAQASTTEVGSLKGKIHYMSPEQVKGEKIDARSDLFSLGALLYEATLGVRPFEGKGPADIALKILNDDPAPADLYVDGFPQELWAVISCLLAKRATDRFASARELQVALDELLVAWKVRASSNEVAACLEQTIPGVGEQVRAFSALAARPANVQRTPSGVSAVKTVGSGPRPMQRAATPIGPRGGAIAVGPTTKVRIGTDTDLAFGDEPTAPAPIGIELSGPTLEGDGQPGRRRDRGSGAWMAIVAIVVIVGVGFYWLTKKADQQAEGGPVPTAVPPVKATPTPTETPKAPVVTPLPKPDAPKPDKNDAPKADAPKTAAPKPAAPKPEKPEKNDGPKKHHHHSEDDGPRTLPHLPTPPPGDDNP